MKSRPRQVGIELTRQLATLLQQRSKDPRLTYASISEVRMSPDLSHARVYVACWQNTDNVLMDDILEALTKATPWLQREVGKTMKLRILPKLHFIQDDVPAQSEEIEILLRSLRPQ